MALANPPVGIMDLSGDPRRRRRELVVKVLFLGAAISAIVISVAIVLSLVREAVTFVTNIDLDRLWADGWYPRRGEFGIPTLFVGSVITSGVAMLVAAPLGLAAAIYLAEYANRRVRKVLKPVLEILAGIPSIVLGFFALTFIQPEIVQSLYPGSGNYSLLAAGLGIGILITPLVASVSEDALRAVPNSLREASYGMGARKATTVIRVVLPAAVSGIVASFVIAISRAIGETMVVALAAGGFGTAQFTVNWQDSGQTITAAMAALASGSDQVAVATGRNAGQAFNSLFFLGLLLFLMTLVLNLIGDAFVRRVRNKY